MIQPLAYRMRPQTIHDVIGQEHLVGQGQIIWRMVEARRLSSMILYGKPGIGKTSIARAIAGSTRYAFRQLNAATDKKKDLEIVVEEAKMSGAIILLLDEIHRLDQPKQDFLLPHLESGLVILVGATTENPYINIHPAIRSRAHIFELHPLLPEEIETGLQRALEDEVNGLGHLNVQIDEEALQHLSRATDGDMRGALNSLELAAESTNPNEVGVIHLTLSIIEECVQRQALTHDKDGDAHYDVISALQKSIRGSDVNASLHYAARLIEAGELEVLCRRLLVIAYEDVGLANPQAAERTVAAVQAARQLGLPEARIPLSNVIIEMSLSPKSNSAYKALDAALSDVRQSHSGQVPAHLKDAHYSGAKKLQRGINYLYPHDYPGHIVAQEYLPKNLIGREYFKPGADAKFEKAYAERYKTIKNILKNKGQ